MEKINRKDHWENIYSTKALNEVSWYQPTPETSLKFIKSLNLNLDDAIIDIGGGDSFLVDHLIEQGYTNITVLDISKSAIERAQKRLGNRANEVTWIVEDVTKFTPSHKYMLWHDRAAFHFLNESQEVNNYASNVYNSLNDGGYLIIGTFSKSGPLKCSGIEISQYDVDDLNRTFNSLKLITEENINHKTPFDTYQNFTFCVFKK